MLRREYILRIGHGHVHLLSYHHDCLGVVACVLLILLLLFRLNGALDWSGFAAAHLLSIQINFNIN
jgi:hypothetical protein